MSDNLSDSENIEIAQELQLVTKVLFKHCSKCGVSSKLVQSFPPSRLDAWCDDCFVNTSAIDRTRKCSIGERRKLIERQEAEAKRKVNFVAQLQAEKERRKAERTKNKKVTSKKSKKTVEGAYSLALDFGESNVDAEEEKARDAILAHDARRAYIARAQDRTIFDEDYYGENDDD